MSERSGPGAGGDPAGRRRALSQAATLTGAEAEIREQVFTLLGDDDAGVRHAAVALVGRTGLQPGIEEGLDRSLRDDAPARRAAAVDAYGRLGVAAVPLLRALLDEESAALRRLAVDALGLTGVDEAAVPLRLALEDSSAAVRAAAVEALCRVAPDTAAPTLRTLLRRADEPSAVRLSVLLSLERLQVTPDPEDLRPHVKDPMTAVPALRLLGAAGAARDLVEALGGRKGPRLRAALAGLSQAVLVDKSAVARAVNAKPLDLETLRELLTGPDASAAAGALLVGALLGEPEWFAPVARRLDRQRLLEPAHVAARELRHRDGAGALRRLAQEVDEEAAAVFLTELAQGIEESAPPPPPRPPRRPSLDDASFRALATLFRDVAGLHFDEHATYRLESRLQARLEAVEAEDFASYVRLLQDPGPAGRAELAAALERVTVHETYFFRERPQLDAFSRHVVPLLKKEAGRRPVRLWSAGSSTGEEVWTLAMILDEAGLGARRYEIFGSDIAPGVVETAQQGVYGHRGLRGEISGATRERYFEPADAGGLRIVDALRPQVHFEVKNLLSPADTSSVGRFDVIFCRNVLIYLTREARNALIQRFYELLYPGGLLFLGHSESLLSLDTPFAFAPISRELVYIRPSEQGAGRLGDHLLHGGRE